MNVTLKRAVLMTAFAALIAPAYGPTLKASPAQQTDRAAQKPAPVTGELVKVDPVAKTLSVKMAGGAEMLFSYNGSDHRDRRREERGRARHDERRPGDGDVQGRRDE